MRFFLIFWIGIFFSVALKAQGSLLSGATEHSFETFIENSAGHSISADIERPKKITQRNAVRFTMAPVLLVTAGVYTLETRNFLNKYRMQETVQNALSNNFRTSIDDYTQYAPQVYTLGYTLMRKTPVKSLRSTLTKMALSNLIMHFTVDAGKNFYAMPRPDNAYARSSFPSGHTAQAFVSATVMHKELGHESIWYSIAGYTVASATGAMRVMNNRHYISDVLVGAGVGIFTTHLSYWMVETLEKKFSKKKKTIRVAKP